MTDAFDQMLSRRPQMTADEARDIVAEMMRETPAPARKRLINVALRMGNLSDGAKIVYRKALAAS